MKCQKLWDVQDSGSGTDFIRSRDVSTPWYLEVRRGGEMSGAKLLYVLRETRGGISAGFSAGVRFISCSLSASAVPQGSHGLRRAQRNRFSGCDCSLGYVLISSYSKSRLGVDMPACGKDGVYPADQAGVPDE